MANRQSSIVNNKSQRVWHVTDFDELFKLPDDLRKGRKGPLSYTKSFVSLSGQSTPTEVRHYEMLKTLKAQPERHLLRSTFEDSKNWTGNKPQHQQGYFVDADGRPADYEYIANQINVDKSELKKAFPILAKIGLIERVSLNGQFQQEAEEKKDKKKRKKRDSKAGNEVRPERSGKGRTISAAVRTPLNKLKSKSKSKSKKNCTAYDSKSTIGSAEVRDEKVGLSAEEKEKAKHCGNSQGKEKSKSQAATTPATTPPILPTKSDEGGSVQKAIPLARPPGSVNASDPAHISHSVERVMRRCNMAAQKAAREIFEALGKPYEYGSRQANRDIGAFARAFEKVLYSGLSPPAINELWESLIKEAHRLKKIYRSEGGYESAKKVWFQPIFQEKLMDRLKKCKVM